MAFTEKEHSLKCLVGVKNKGPIQRKRIFDGSFFLIDFHLGLSFLAPLIEA